MGRLTVFTPAAPQRVQAWVLWEDGVEELLPAYAIAWTKRAVLVRFGAPPHQHDVWVWAGAVERAWRLGLMLSPVPNRAALTKGRTFPTARHRKPRS